MQAHYPSRIFEAYGVGVWASLWAILNFRGLILPFRIRNSVDGVDPDQSVLEIGVEGKTAGCPTLCDFQRVGV